MRLEAQAKVNIGLIVGEARPDGYHFIETVMARISLSDIIEAELSKSSELSVSIDGCDCYLDGGIDLMEKAARAFSEMTGIRFSLHLSIDKRIPSGCGLGGGSSDAASVLRFLNHSFSDPLDDDGILECALSIGSDVPFFASGMPSALCRGRGELLEPAMAPHGARILLFIPPERTATRDAYGRLDAIPRPERHLRTDAELTRQAFPNDFELISPPPPAEVGCFPYFSLTGSGSAWYAILPDTAAPKFDNPGKYAIVSAYII